MMLRLLTPKEQLRSRISFILEIERFLKDNWLDRHRKSLVSLKREVRSTWNSGVDPLAKPITEEWRRFYGDECGESWSEYTIVKDWTSLPDEEIAAKLHAYRREIHSMYDCTGKPFTISMHWSRQPCGIVVVHRLVLDV